MRDRNGASVSLRLAITGLYFAMGLAAAGAAWGQDAPAGLPPGGPPPGGLPPGGFPAGGLPAGGLPAGGPPSSLLGTVFPKPPSANAPKANKDPRDFEGIYVGLLDGLPMPGSDGDGYTPRAREIVDRRMKLARHQLSVEGPAQRCRPYNNVTNVAQPVFPMMIVQNEKRVVLITEEGRSVWEIYLDRGHPQTVTPTYNGHSVGHWDGDTLVVDTIGYNGKAFLDLMAGPNSDKAHYSIRITKNVENGNLNFSYTLEDPEIYAQPKKASVGLMWHPELKLNEFDCESALGLGTFPGLVTPAQEAAVAASLPD